MDMNDNEVKAHQKLLDEEAQVKEKIDTHGNRWRKAYFGGGVHFQNWLDQSIELCGKQNVEVEEVAVKGLQCFEQGGEKMYRIWVKDVKNRL
jgi:hypothetical protein